MEQVCDGIQDCAVGDDETECGKYFNSISAILSNTGYIYAGVTQNNDHL